MNKHLPRMVPRLAARFVLGIAVFALATGASVMALRAQGAARTVWNGVFTAEQAAQGKAVFENKCATCHGAELNGGEMSPPLAGAMFVSNWSGQSVGDLFTRIRTTMP